MAKKVKSIVKLQIAAGKANPAPPVGSSLGQHGVNIQEFCTKFNEKTKKMMGDNVPVVITIYEDRTFTFITKTPPAADLIKKAAGIEKGSGTTGKGVAGSITHKQAEEIAARKLEDLNAHDVAAATKIVEGTARSMGISVK